MLQVIPMSQSNHAFEAMLRKNPGIETPKTKIQTPKKSQVPSSKPLPALRAWNLELGASLVFGAWWLGPGASLELGVWNLELVAWALSFSKIEIRLTAARSEGLT